MPFIAYNPGRRLAAETNSFNNNPLYEGKGAIRTNPLFQASANELNHANVGYNLPDQAPAGANRRTLRQKLLEKLNKVAREVRHGASSSVDKISGAASHVRQTLPDIKVPKLNLFKRPNAVENPIVIEMPNTPSWDDARQQLIAALPVGVDVDDDGVISGEFKIGDFPNDPMLGLDKNKTLSEVIATSSVKNLAKDTVSVSLKDGRLCQIAPQARSDFYRLNMTIGENFSTEKIKTLEDEKDRIKAVAGALFKLTDEDAEATKLLSSVLNQNMTFFVTNGLTAADGRRARLAPPSNSMKTWNSEKTDQFFRLRRPDGVEELVEAGQMAGLTYSLTKNEDGFYSVRLNGRTYFGGIRNETGIGSIEIPAMKKSVIAADIDFGFEVEIADRQLRVRDKPTGSVTFSGRMASREDFGA